MGSSRLITLSKMPHIANTYWHPIWMSHMWNACVTYWDAVEMWTGKFGHGFLQYKWVLSVCFHFIPVLFLFHGQCPKGNEFGFLSHIHSESTYLNIYYRDVVIYCRPTQFLPLSKINDKKTKSLKWLPEKSNLVSDSQMLLPRIMLEKIKQI